MALLATYARALREEPKIRAYLAASIVDDIGVAVVGWAGVLLMVNLFKDQRARASIMLPSLVCFLIGALVAGPLADWERSAARIGAYRWKLVVWGRFVETIGLGSVVLSTARGPTIANLMPYMLLSALMKTGLGPTREAFFVDLLQREDVRIDASGAPMHDEHGQPLMVKSHLLTSEALVKVLRAGSALLGLLMGGLVVRAVHQRYEILFAIDIGTTLDGLVMVVAGQVAMPGSVRVLVPFAAVMTVDRALVGPGTTTDALGVLAMASAASATIRGRVLAVVPVAAILGDMLAEALSTPISERYGVPAMLRGLGVVQIALMLAVTVAGGSALWRYGIRSQPVTSPEGA